jgi:lipopolysaccharide/colanic/teichoic acid biosynthesis glycosyltransferase
VTGWAQVSGVRGNTSMRDRVGGNNHHRENWPLWLDLKVLLLTIGALFPGSRDALTPWRTASAGSPSRTSG